MDDTLKLYIVKNISSKYFPVEVDHSVVDVHLVLQHLVHAALYPTALQVHHH